MDTFSKARHVACLSARGIVASLPSSRYFLLLWLFVIAFFASTARADVQYFYDELSRLVQVIDPSGNAAQYNYDPAGNIKSITQVASTALSIAEFSPNAGPVGATVNIYGTGFNTTATSNTVKFNGTTVTVTTATANQLTTTVPTGATTGTISVSNGTSTVTSAQPFTVIAATAPGITSFTPTSGAAGTAVTITGKNFDLKAANDKVRFNGIEALVTGATATQVNTTVPNNTSSGKITVATSYGIATSAADFIVPPSGYTIADIGKTARATVGSSAVTLNTTTAGKIGLLLFDGTIGQNIGIGISNITTNPAGGGGRIYVKKPNGQDLIGSVAFSKFGISIHLPTLTATGTYTLVIVPESSTSTVSITTALSADIAGTLPVDGSVTFTSTRIGQAGRYTFSGTAGQHLGAGITGITFNPANGNATVYIKKPDGQDLLPSQGFDVNGVALNFPVLPASGTYTLLVIPNTANALTAAIALSNDTGGTLIANGAAQTLTIARPGQNGRYTFNATAGQNISVSFTGATFPFNGSSLIFYLYKPDGSLVRNGDFLSGFVNGVLDYNNLPASGTYTLFIDPPSTSTGQMGVQLLLEASGTLALDGTPSNIALMAGQNGRYTFTGTAGQSIGFGISALTTTPSGGGARFQVLAPDGSLFFNCDFYGSPGGNCPLPKLVNSGTYTLLVNPDSTYAASMTLTLSTELTGTLTIGGPAVTFATNRVGQSGRYTFTGSLNQFLTLVWTGSTFGRADITFYKPDGNGWTGFNTNNATDFTNNLGNLPASGTYTLLIAPTGIATGQITLQLQTQ